jgi:hypothetical protein
MVIAVALIQTPSQWISTLASELSAKPQNAAIIDKPVTDIAPPSVEDISSGPLEVEPETVPVKAVAEQVETDADEDPEQAEKVPGVEPVMAETAITAATAEEQAVVVRDVIPEPEMAVSEHDDVLLQTTMSETASSEEPTTRTSADFSSTADNDQWLSAKLRESLEWLSQADGDSVSIQVLIRNKAAVKDLVYFLRNDWPLDISITYLYEVNLEDLSIYRVFYSQFNSLSKGRDQIDLLPDSVKVNSPYLQSVHRMQKALL